MCLLLPQEPSEVMMMVLMMIGAAAAAVYDNSDDDDGDIYIMMKCLSVCVSRKMITSSWESPVTT